MSASGKGPAYCVRTERTVIRCWNPSDASLLKEAIDSSIDHLRPWMPWAENEPTEIDAKVQLLRSFRGNFDLGKDFTYGIFDLDERRVLGGTGLHTRIGEGSWRSAIGYVWTAQIADWQPRSQLPFRGWHSRCIRSIG